MNRSTSDTRLATDTSLTMHEIASPVSTWREVLSAYHELTKPGITLMVSVSAAAGFWLALPRNTHVFLTIEYALLFVLAVAGTALVSAGSCALNHVLEHRFDREMKRTMFRPIPSGRVSRASAAVFGIGLSVAGLVMLTQVNMLTMALAALTSFLYLAVYTPMKRTTQLSTLVGGIPGALPPLGGWTAVTGAVSMEAVILFLILFLWQMPHFLSLAWMYRKDYERGGFPMLTVLDEEGVTVARHVVVYTLLLVVFSLALAVSGATGLVYFAGALVLGVVFTAMGVRFLAERSNGRARAVLITSYMYLLILLTLMFVDKA
jgi:heme o synthase